MKVLLTQPIVNCVDFPPNIPDLGMGYITRHLRNVGIEVLVNDWNMEPPEAAFRSMLSAFRPRVAGIKVFTKDLGAALKTISVIKEVAPETVVVIGGPHPSCSVPEDVMAEFPDADFAFREEAEIGFPTFRGQLEQNDLEAMVQQHGADDSRSGVARTRRSQIQRQTPRRQPRHVGGPGSGLHGSKQLHL